MHFVSNYFGVLGMRLRMSALTMAPIDHLSLKGLCNHMKANRFIAVHKSIQKTGLWPQNERRQTGLGLGIGKVAAVELGKPRPSATSSVLVPGPPPLP